MRCGSPGSASALAVSVRCRDARDVNVSGRHTLGSALVIASSRCSVEEVQRGSPSQTVAEGIG